MKLNSTTYTKKNYETNKSTILSDLKKEKLRNRQGLLKARNFPEITSPWARLNKIYITLRFQNPTELYDFLNLKDEINNELEECEKIDNKNLNKIPFTPEIILNELQETINNDRLRNRRDLLVIKCFPPQLAPWARINKKYVTLSFENYYDLKRFMLLSDIIVKDLPLCIEKRIQFDITEAAYKETQKKDNSNKEYDNSEQ